MRPPFSISSRYKFTGQEFDDETGLFNFRARLYDPAIGMFYGVDPAGQGYSPYGYAGNNPVTFVDRDGREFFAVMATIFKVAKWAYAAYSGYRAVKEKRVREFINNIGINILTDYAFSNSPVSTETPTDYWSTKVVKSSMMSMVSSGVSGGNPVEGMLLGAIDEGITGGVETLDALESLGWDWSSSVKREDVPAFAKEIFPPFDAPMEQVEPMYFEDYMHFKDDSPSGYKLGNDGYYYKSHCKSCPPCHGLTRRDGSSFTIEGYKSYGSNIWIAPADLSSRWRLYITLGHELIHAHDYFTGYAASKGRWNPRGNAMTVANNLLERRAYSWSSNAASQFSNYPGGLSLFKTPFVRIRAVLVLF